MVGLMIVQLVLRLVIGRLMMLGLMLNYQSGKSSDCQDNRNKDRYLVIPEPVADFAEKLPNGFPYQVEEKEKYYNSACYRQP